MKLIYRPIDTWPGELTRDRKPSPFSGDWRSTMEILEREVGVLAGTDTRHFHAEAVVQLAVPEGAIRQDGQLAAGRREPEHPGVILTVETDQGPLRFSCDRFDAGWRSSNRSEPWRQNLRAIALGLEALRKVERYGLGTGREQYAGFQALPPSTPMGPAALTKDEAARLLADAADLHQPGDVPALLNDPNVVAAAYRAAAKTMHPDAGGDPAMFRLVTEARDLLSGATS